MKLRLPEGLCPESIQFVEDLYEELERQDITQVLDLPLLELASSVYHVYFIARKDIIKNGATYQAEGYGGGDKLTKLSPNFKVMQDSQIQLMKIIAELGLSPRSRKQISQMPVSDFEQESPLKAFLTTKPN